VMTGQLLNYDDVKRLEKLPTKQQLIATIARLIKQVTANPAFPSPSQRRLWRQSCGPGLGSAGAGAMDGAGMQLGSGVTWVAGVLCG
jgi:hypothetical protein